VLHLFEVSKQNLAILLSQAVSVHRHVRKSTAPIAGTVDAIPPVVAVDFW